MPSDTDYTRMKRLADLALAHGTAFAYAPWLLAKGGGLKAQAKSALGTFLAEAQAWPETVRRDFIVWLDRARQEFNDRKAITPHPVMTKLVLPTLQVWIANEPDAAWPHILLGRFHDWKLDAVPPEVHFRAALRRDPAITEAQRGLAFALVDIVEYNQHHLPGAYFGDRAEDVARMDEVLILSGAVPDAGESAWLNRRARTLRGHAAGETVSLGAASYPFDTGRPQSSP
ncbi:MAG TPA: hypothetical protein VN047_09150 [Sphingopyxis sp.]|uniref:hypothetical protein n=1 Tax=Sphingopyxis sp. TaxID=1908224 RepID=UPI002BAC721F|nr:hypothetical protein [Sphingopyxis sp.]HWW57046.1 hypothetical protein [Sphingopyxis sp.]